MSIWNGSTKLAGAFRGKSAYEQAKAGGYSGTEDQFNSIMNTAINFMNRTDNPSKVTASQVGAPASTQKDITYYVDAINGNDSNDGSSSNTAFKTVQHAIDLIPQVVNHNVTINMAQNVTYTSSTSSTTNKMPCNHSWISVTYGNGTYVAVSGISSIVAAYSTDGINWTASVLPSSQEWYSVTYGNGKFVAVAYSDSTAAAYSTDGINWTASVLPSGQYWQSVTYGNGKFVAVAYSDSTYNKTNVAAYSTDGITWTASTMPSSQYWKSITYGNGKFVAVAYSDSTAAAYSTDGINWTASVLPSGQYWQSVTYGNGKFVAVSSNSSNVAAYSTDGITWTAITMPSSQEWISVTYGNNKFVAVAYNKSTAAAYSTDGINWTASVLPSGQNYYFINYCNDKFITTSIDSDTELYSSDGITWTQTTFPSQYWNSVTYGNGKFVAVSGGNTTSNVAAYSTDGITWTASTMPSSQIWRSITYGYNKFVAIAQNTSAAAYSTDGITWTAITMPSSQEWISVTYGNNKFVAIAQNTSVAAYSTDGITWTASTMPSSQNWQHITYGNGKFVAISGDVATSNVAAYSTDGITWTASTLPSSQIWRSITYGHNKFVAIAQNTSAAAYSTDGITWTAGTMPNNNPWFSITFGNGIFVATSCGTTVSNVAAYSYDGIIWHSFTLSSSQSWSYLAFGNNNFVAVSYTAGVSENIIINTTSTTTGDEDITISGKIGSGGITLQGGTDLDSATNFAIKSFMCTNCTCITTVNGVISTNINSNEDSFTNKNSSFITFNYCKSIFTNLSGNGINATDNGYTWINNCELSNKNNAIACVIGNVTVTNTTGSGNNFAYLSMMGSIYLMDLNYINALYQFNTTDGGQVIGPDGKSTADSGENLLINGDFKIWKRGEDIGYDIDRKYCADRWILDLSYGTAVTSRTAYGLFFNSTSATGWPGIQQNLELNADFIGKIVTFSACVFSTDKCKIIIQKRDKDGNYTTLAGTTPVISNYNILSCTTKLDNLSLTDSLAVKIQCQNSINEFSIFWAKLEISSVPTPFEPRPYAEELAMCQRYFRRYKATSSYTCYGNGLCVKTTLAGIYIPFGIQMRSIPTFSSSAYSTFILTNGNTNYLTADITSTTDSYGADLAVTTSGLAAGQACQLQSNNNTDSYLDFDAEIY